MMRILSMLAMAGVAVGSRYLEDDVPLMQAAMSALVQQQASVGEYEELKTPPCTEPIWFGNPDPETTHSNLDGQGPDSGVAEEIRIGSVGSESGVTFDVAISKQSGSTYVANKIYRNAVTEDGTWVQVNQEQGNTVDLTVMFFESGTTNPISLPLVKMTMCDIDQGDTGTGGRYEEYVLTADAFYFYTYPPDFTVYFGGATIAVTPTATVLDPSVMVQKVTNSGGGQLTMTATSTQKGTGCDNPTGPDTLQNPFVYANNAECVSAGKSGWTTFNQADRCFMFEQQASSGFDLTFTVGAHSSTHGRSFLMGGASAILDTTPECPTPAPTPAPPTAAPPTPADPSATGDPHMKNVRGERFNVRQPGLHMLLTVPKGSHADAVKLRVDASVEAEAADPCSALFIRRIDVAGGWLGTTPILTLSAGDRPGLMVGNTSALTIEEFLSRVPADMVKLILPDTAVAEPTLANRHATIMTALFKFETGVTMKVSWVSERLPTRSIAKGLWVSFTGLSAVRDPIGGLLGTDDHHLASMPYLSCDDDQANRKRRRTQEQEIASATLDA